MEQTVGKATSYTSVKSVATGISVDGTDVVSSNLEWMTMPDVSSFVLFAAVMCERDGTRMVMKEESTNQGRSAGA